MAVGWIVVCRGSDFDARSPGGFARAAEPHGRAAVRRCYHPGRRRAFARIASTGSAVELATEQEISQVLAQAERRAYKQALFAVRDEQVALDVVQDAMLKLAERYAHKPVEELPLLFQRILQNTIRDHFRRQKVRSLWSTLLSSLSPADDEDSDPLEHIASDTGPGRSSNPADEAERAETARHIERALARLPARQREAFLLRYWEELDVAETAAVMGCSEGSVKTHCSRATHAIAAFLREKGLEP
jgi:RNA polymerase sigma-70 factor (ECF subfamily)